MTALKGISTGIAVYLIMAVPQVNIKPDVSTIVGRIAYYCDLYEKLAPPYIWEGSFGKLGGDCSGQAGEIVNNSVNDALGKVFKKAGSPFKRETAFGMWSGRGGWGTNNVKGSASIFKSSFPNVVFWDYTKPTKPVQFHVAIIRNVKSNWLDFSEASSGKGYFKRTEMRLGDGRYKHLVGYKILPLEELFKTN